MDGNVIDVEHEGLVGILQFNDVPEFFAISATEKIYTLNLA